VDTEKALLAAIWAAPHDDLPRLVYADWLDESGDPAKAARAEFIRVQCELAKMVNQQLRHPVRSELKTQIREIDDRRMFSSTGICTHSILSVP
jgi:uncharacterized protein (TIGR02996 family)